MKTIILALSLLTCSGLIAQEKAPVDKMEATKTTTTTVDKNGEKVILSKVKETTRKEQVIKTQQRGGNTVNGDKIDTPIEVTKTMQIDSAWDPFYDVSVKSKTYDFNGEQMTFSSNDSGFLMSSTDDASYGEARETSNRHLYLTTTKGHPGVGYFDSNGSFVIEYYNKEQNMMVTEIYKLNEF